MGILDLRTIVLSHLATGLMCALVIGCLWGQYRKRYAGLSFWLADFVLQFAAALLLGLRGQIPDWMSMVLANTLTLTGAFLGYVGLERFVGQISRQWHNYTLLVVFVVVHSYFSMVEPNLTARELNVSAGLFLLCFQCLWLMLWRVNPDLRRITGGVGLVFGAFCLVSLTRIPVLLAHPHTTDDYFKSGLVAGLFLMAYQFRWSDSGSQRRLCEPDGLSALRSRREDHFRYTSVEPGGRSKLRPQRAAPGPARSRKRVPPSQKVRRIGAVPVFRGAIVD